MTKWGTWDACSRECGGGIARRARTIAVPASNSGKPCPHFEESRACNEGGCGLCRHCAPKIAGGGWELVRRVGPGLVWHQAKDKLQGTDVYGNPVSDPTAETSFSLRFDNLAYNQLLLATGDMSRWMVVARDEVTRTGDQFKAAVVMSSVKATPYTAMWSNPKGKDKMTISATPSSETPDVSHILYEENAAQGTLNKGGMNVWIRGWESDTQTARDLRA